MIRVNLLPREDKVQRKAMSLDIQFADVLLPTPVRTVDATNKGDRHGRK